ncbi:hypothetical protein SASPL_157777 [Salvia splendens]|uniref:Uncharacterized protein n=1 Tax=Salvia splendens TaxID=180675 RepID=A0A8X8VUD7_SALSN|nr:uncharacterized protein LOC121788466 [Salvia splendens]KAG6382551.1 hypothetical protein SASPL_157777 [Salvia splendens]
MSVALISLSNPLTLRPATPSILPAAGKPFSISCRHAEGDHRTNNDFPRISENQLSKLALAAMAAGVLTLGSVDPAAAAKTGGRIGGQAFRPSAPRASAPTPNTSRTNIYVNPPVAPPLVGGYGYGFGVPYYGGWGWSPFSFFAPAPGVAVGVGGGFDLFLLFIVLGAASAFIRRLFRSRQDDDEY